MTGTLAPPHSTRGLLAAFLVLQLFWQLFWQLLWTTPCNAQLRGDLRLSLGLSFPKGIIISATYFPVDYAGIEVHGGAIPHLFNYGFGLSYYLSKFDSPNTYLSSQFTVMQAWKGDAANPADSTAKTFSIFLMDLGAGKRFSSPVNEFYLLIGPAVGFIETQSRHPVYGMLSADRGIVTPFIDGGIIVKGLQ